jgi:hypothetical protein
VDGVKATARLQKNLSNNNSYHIGNFRLPSREFTKSDQEVADHLLETHFPGCERSSDENSTTLEIASLPTESNWLEASGIIFEDKIQWAIADFGPFTTAGEDGIFPALLKNVIEVLTSLPNRKKKVKPLIFQYFSSNCCCSVIFFDEILI